MERKIIAFIQALVGFEWFMAGVEKLKPGHAEYTKDFVKSVGYFASKNPNSSYKAFLVERVIPAKETFAYIIPWGEFLAGLGLLVGGTLLFFGKDSKFAKYASVGAILGSLFMNVNFYLAASWTSISTKSLNILMIGLEIALLVFWLKPRYKDKKKK